MGIFLSYRRADSHEVVGRIYDRLISHFPIDRVFRDLDSLTIGRPFPQALDEAVANANVALVVMGPSWASITDSEGRRRLDSPSDFVRLEVEKALGAGFPVVPVLVSHSTMPNDRDLPESLRPLVYRHGFPVRPDPDFHRDMDRLIGKLSELLDLTAARPNKPRGDNLLHRLWDDLDPELQDAFALAYNQARREKKDRISTRTFFAALARLEPGKLPELFDLLPMGSLPEPIASDVPTQHKVLEAAPKLSSCVENALLHLEGVKTSGLKLGTADMFVDIAKFGTGPSVVRLRTHGVTPEVVDNLVGQLGWSVLRR